MPDAIRAASLLPEAAEEVLETMFFTSAAPAENPRPGAGRALAVRVRFEGAPSGTFGLAVDEAQARRIASNFLGAEDEAALTGGQITDVMCELANMICGSVLSRLEANATFDIERPEPLDGGEEFPPGLDARCYLDVDEGTLALAIDFDEEEP